MTSASIHSKRAIAVLAGSAAIAVALAGCTPSGDTTDDGGDNVILVGTTDKVTTLDPAGSYDNGSLTLQTQVFPYLLNSQYGSPDIEPDIAVSAEFTAPTEYTVVLKEGLKWANGNDLTASDVKFTFDRQLSIPEASEAGPASLLYNLESTEAVDDTTVIFHLKTENDQVFPQILSSFPGAIVDEEVFSTDSLTSDEDIVAGNAFAGQYYIDSYDFNQTISMLPYDGYQGLLGPADNDGVILSYYADSSNLKLDVQSGEVDVAFRSLAPTDIEDLRGDDAVKVIDGPGGEIRYMVFNFDTMAYGAKTPEADPAKALAVRQAAASLVDRAEIASQVYKDTYTPLYSFIPDGFTGATTVLKDLYGDGEGGPDADKAAAILEDAGVTTPVVLNLQYNADDHYGPSSGDEYALVESQLEASGLFDVNLQSTEWVQYTVDYRNDVYPVFQLGWFPDYSDGDNYLTPFFLEGGFFNNHYSNPEVDELILQQGVTVDFDERTALIEEIQDKVAADMPTLPLLQGAQLAVTGTDVSGAVLDASFKFRFAPLTK